jgi:short-subunit dehydrogenase
MGKNCFITGAASGIGRSFAYALAKLGTNLYITDINMDGLEKVRSEIEKNGVKVVSSKCDVSVFEDFERCSKEFIEKFGEIDLLINNAGISIGGNIADINLNDWKKVIDTNLWSMIYSIKVFLPRMIKRGSGYIATVASGAGILGSAEALPYIASKFAIVGLSESYFARLKNMGINVSVIVPWIINTAIWKPDLSKAVYHPKMLADFGKEKLDLVYNTMWDDIMEISTSSDDAVAKYIEGIKENRLYIFDNDVYYEHLALKGTNPSEYENFLVQMQVNRAQRLREHFLKHGIKLEEYL